MAFEIVRDAARTSEPALEDLSPEFLEELDRRIQNAESSPAAGRPWRDVMAELRTRLS